MQGRVLRGHNLAVGGGGDGKVLCDVDSPDPIWCVLANRVGCRVVSVGCRHAPASRFPAAVENAYAATSDKCLTGLGFPLYVL